ncbi:MAG: exo-alpha-sialidase [Clostridia bacterium]|nr:exo-alpha-sialidase [Clostridia bacterium]
MLITDSNKLAQFDTAHRLWQGIPSIEVTKGGRIFSTFYSGGTGEQVNNFAVLLQSDNGIDFGEPIAVAFAEGHRCYDPCLWIDPLGRLWFTWACAPEHAVYAAICADPDAKELSWEPARKIGEDVMMNKPTVLSSGEWLFPIAVWHRDVTTGGFRSESDDSERKAFVYKSTDGGKTLVRRGGADVAERSFDEHMILERNDGTLEMYVRTEYGIGVAYSADGGETWSEGEDSGLGGPCSRFFIRRLKSGRVLLVNHYQNVGRSHLTAMLSEDEGKTWPYKFLLDERTEVSYPDAKEADDGYLYITYDRERGGFLHNLAQVYGSAREILFAKITEADILAGKLTDPNSRLKCVVNKLGRYVFEDEVHFD